MGLITDAMGALLKENNLKGFSKEVVNIVNQLDKPNIVNKILVTGRFTEIIQKLTKLSELQLRKQARQMQQHNNYQQIVNNQNRR